MTFGEALEHAKTGKTISREAWIAKKVSCDYTTDCQTYLKIVVDEKQPVPYYQSNEDIFANDWIIL